MSRFQTSFETSPLLPSDDAEEHNVFNAGHGSQNASPESPALCNAPISSQRALVFRIGAAMYSFIVLGLFTSSLGVMLPHLESYYRLTDTHVSLIFLVGPIGYILAAQSTESIHRRFGQRGIALLGPFFHFFPAAVISTHPPFWIVLIGYAIVTFGTGLLDSSWCAWAGGMGERANTVSGMLHGSYSGGAAVGPLLAGMLIDPGNKPWWNWYYMLVSLFPLALFFVCLQLD
jgi:fucose permease